MDLTLATQTRGDFIVIAVGGEIDVYTAPQLRELVVGLVDEGQVQLICDLSEVQFLDSTGLGVLVGALNRVRAHEGTLSLVVTEERILKVFEITGLRKVFPIHATVDAALELRD